MSVDVLNEPCAVWFAVVGVRVGMNFLCVLHSVRMVWLRHGSVAGVLNEPCTVWFVVVGVRVGLNFLGVLHSVRMVLLRFGDVSGCAEWAVHSVICCRWCEGWIEFSWCSTQCAHGFVKVWWCQWMCWMSRAQCDLLSLVWGLDWIFLVFYTVCAWFC